MNLLVNDHSHFLYKKLRHCRNVEKRETMWKIDNKVCELNIAADAGYLVYDR
uniref:Uncharacterized protein n=1 Tax=Arion vulgaris TaxID=1028688 RepID=A0A0B6ZEN2_9EUPU